ncbi:MAG: glycosyl transferase family 1 [Ignavibacteriae bacterium HGW-Ignavibacteriae-2]|jgi:glycosyltransferase involved in cell wall biosynthesis|nr:MAG: glycosyl transferase family 1 [Ignavibacteriae bacterium HGW-Ignavibacteriae-2]
MFKVLVIAYYYPPMGLSGVQRTLKFTKYMSHYNWEPTVITAGSTGYYAHDNSLMKEAEKAEIRIVRTESSDINSRLAKYGTIEMPNEKIRKFLSRVSKTFLIPDNKVDWANRAYKKAEELLQNEKFDVIFVSIPPFSAFKMATKLKAKFKLPLIVDYRDLWYGNHFAFYPTPYHKIRHKKLEESALRAADHIIAVNRNVKEKLITTYKFLKFEDVTILPHGFDPADFEGVKRVNDKSLKRKIKILYSGIFYENVTPKYFLKAFKKLTIDEPQIAENFELHFVGLFRRENEKHVKNWNLHRFIHIHGYLNHEDVIQKLVDSDILWVMLGNGKNMNMVSSGKIFEYFGSRKPILVCAPDGATRSAAKEYGASYIVDPEDIEGMKQKLIEIYKQFVKNELPIPGEDFILKHDRNFLTKQLTQQFQFYIRED